MYKNSILQSAVHVYAQSLAQISKVHFKIPHIISCTYIDVYFIEKLKCKRSWIRIHFVSSSLKFTAVPVSIYDPVRTFEMPNENQLRNSNTFLGNQTIKAEFNGGATSTGKFPHNIKFNL